MKSYSNKPKLCPISVILKQAVVAEWSNIHILVEFAKMSERITNIEQTALKEKLLSSLSIVTMIVHVFPSYVSLDMRINNKNHLN